MRLGVGLPNGLGGVDPGIVAEWARRADDSPLASLAVVDRIVYDSLDPVVSLAAAAAVTERIELVTSILIAPLRETTTMAKQLLSLHALAPGRFTAGLAIGARGDDYDVSEFGQSTRGQRLTDQLAQLRRLEDEGDVRVPGENAPLRLLVGGTSGPALSRMAQLADGWIHGGSPPGVFSRQVGQARAAWADAGRPGAPEVWSMAYFALGDTAGPGRDYLLDYYAFTGAFAPRIADGLLTSPLEIREYAQAYADAGCDHLLLFPTVPDLAQLDLLAEVAAGTASAGGADEQPAR